MSGLKHLTKLQETALGELRKPNALDVNFVIAFANFQELKDRVSGEMWSVKIDMENYILECTTPEQEYNEYKFSVLPKLYEFMILELTERLV